VVSGGPGSGKSGVLARLVTASDPGFRRRHPPASDDPLRELPEGAVDVAVPARDLDPTQILQALAEGVDCDATDVDELVAALAAHGRPVTLVVDGLDESTRPRPAAAVLRRAAGESADLGVRLLVGTRPGPHKNLLQALGASAARNAIDLDDTAYLEKADLAEYVRRRLLLEGVPPDRLPARDTPYRDHDRLAERVAERVADRAYPSFLIAALTAVGLVRSGTAVDVDVDGWDQFPTTVAAAMDDYLDRFDQDRDRVEDLLRPLAYSYGDGLPPGELWAGLAVRLAVPGRIYNEVDIRWLLDTAADYLLETTADTGTGSGTAYRLYHQALIDRLRDQDPAGGGPVEERAYRWLLDSVPGRPQGHADWQRAHLYILTHLADHAAATGHLGDLVDDPGFLVAADPATLTASLRQFPQLTSPGARTYRMAAHLLADRADRLFQLQLHAARLGETTLERQLAVLAVRSRPRLAWTQEPRHTPHYTLGRHTGPVTAVAVGELDGRPVVVSGGGDSTVRVWDLGTGNPVGAPFTGHTDWVTGVAVGELHGHPVVVSGSRDRTVRVWDLATGDPVGAPFTGHTDWVTGVAVGELDGHPIVVSSGGGAPIRTVRVWDLGTGNRRVGAPFTGRTGMVWAVAVGALDGRPVVVSGSRDRTVRVWDLATGNPVGAPFTGHTDVVSAVAVGALQGRPIVVSGSHDSTVRVWDLGTGNPVGDPFTGHRGVVSAVAVGALDGRPIVVSGGGGADSTVRVWDLGTGDPVGDPFTRHTDQITAVAVGEVDGRPVVVSGSRDRTVRVRDLATGGNPRVIRLDNSIYSVTKPKNNLMVIGHEAGLTAIRI
jgi:WD40 repeat protein